MLKFVNALVTFNTLTSSNLNVSYELGSVKYFFEIFRMNGFLWKDTDGFTPLERIVFFKVGLDNLLFFQGFIIGISG